MNVKGLSNIIGVVLLILMGIIALSLLWVYVSEFVGKSTLSPAFSCLDLQLNNKISLQNACYNSESGDIELRILRLGDGLDINNLYFIMQSDSGNSRWCCGEDCEACGVVEDGSSRDYYLSGDGSERKLLLEIFGCVVDEEVIEVC